MRHASTKSWITPSRKLRGVTLIELMIGVAVLALMLMSAAPAFSDWIRNTQIRSASESILNGIHYARTEAVRRNTITRFQLTTSLDGGCAISDSARNWVVSIGKTTPAGKCDKDQPGAQAVVLQKSPITTNAFMNIKAERSVIAFNGLGQQIQVDGQPPRVMSKITLESSQSPCLTPGGPGSVRCLRIELARGGQARLCDPGLAGNSLNRTMACLTP